MAAFVLVDIEVTDPTAFEEYKELAAPIVVAHGGKYLARGGTVEVLEGDWHTGRFVILEFPTPAMARAFWNSETYRPAKALRQACAKTKMILVEGV